MDVAKSRAILAFGISCFEEHLDKSTCTSDNTSTKYKVHTFNLGVLCNQEFIVEPASLQFLIQHGFDFNKQFSKGISYHKGADKVRYITRYTLESFSYEWEVVHVYNTHTVEPG